MQHLRFTKTNLIILKAVFLGLSLLMVFIVVSTSIKSNLFNVSVSEPWFQATLIDFYITTFILAVFVCFKEQNWLRAIGWVIGLITLGSVASCFYLFYLLNQARPGETFLTLLAPKNAQVKEDQEII